MIILFALLPALLGAESAIDWKKCSNVENMCYCRDDPAKPKLRSFTYDATDATADTSCADVGIQNIFYSEKKVVFLIQVMNDDAKTIDPTMELALFNEKAGGASEKLFGCELKNGKVTVTGDSAHINSFKIKLFEEGDRGSLGDASFFKEKHILCAILAERGGGILNFVEERKRQYKTVMKLTGTSSSKIYSLDDNNVFGKGVIKCPYFSFDDRPQLNKPFETKFVLNKDKDEQNCRNYGDSFTMRSENASFEGEIDYLKCMRDENSGEFNLNLVRYIISGTGDKVPEYEKIVNPESYHIYCAAPPDELCTKPMTCDENNDITCPKFVAGSKGNKAKLTCTDDKWVINDQYHIGPVECKRDEHAQSTKPQFFAELTEIKKADRCFTEYDCEKKSYVRRAGNGTVVIENGVLKCRDGDRILTIYDAATNVTMTGQSSYACDTSDGSWKNETNEKTFVVPDGSQALCKAKPKPTAEAKSKISTGQGTLYAVLGSILVIGVMLAAEALFYFCWSRGLLKKNLKVNAIMGKHYKDMPRSELIADCKEDFGKCLQATPETYYLVLEGLKKIDMLLKEEVEDVDAWEEAYKFLMRFHGSIRLVDRPIWHMLSRYLYLETKKIIDKHGWCTNTALRLGSPKGLIRAVAVHLLSFSLHDCKNYDSEKLLIAGYRELAFMGTSQYPHCGMLWSLIYHTRPRKNKRRTDPRSLFKFDYAHFEDTLKRIVKSTSKIPAAEVIPVFGTVPHQAAFAIGALPDTAYIHANSADIVLNTKEKDNNKVAMGYFAGLCQSVMHNPIVNIIAAFNIAKPNPDTLKRLHKAAPEAEWNAVAREGERTMTYYGHHIDAKRLHERFMPDDKDTDFFKMQLDQQEFEGAVEKSKNELREWFAARIDKAEFKQKPAEPTDPAILANVDNKFADYVVPPPKKAAPGTSRKAGSGSKSGSGSGGEAGGSSGSNSSDGKSPAPPPPSEPKEAAGADAAAAAPEAAAAAPASN